MRRMRRKKRWSKTIGEGETGRVTKQLLFFLIALRNWLSIDFPDWEPFALSPVINKPPVNNNNTDSYVNRWSNLLNWKMQDDLIIRTKDGDNEDDGTMAAAAAPMRWTL